MSKLYHARPSEIICVEDEYTAYCFDVACAYITTRIKDGEEPVFGQRGENVEKKHYSSLHDMYDSMGYGYGNYIK